VASRVAQRGLAAATKATSATTAPVACQQVKRRYLCACDPIGRKFLAKKSKKLRVCNADPFVGPRLLRGGAKRPQTEKHGLRYASVPLAVSLHLVVVTSTHWAGLGTKDGLSGKLGSLRLGRARNSLQPGINSCSRHVAGSPATCGGKIGKTFGVRSNSAYAK
jgi:hypothetical protein